MLLGQCACLNYDLLYTNYRQTIYKTTIHKYKSLNKFVSLKKKSLLYSLLKPAFIWWRMTEKNNNIVKYDYT